MNTTLVKTLAEKALKNAMTHDGVYRPEGCLNSCSKSFADEFARLLVVECITALADLRDPSMLNYKPTDKAKEAIAMKFDVWDWM